MKKKRNHGHNGISCSCYTVITWPESRKLFIRQAWRAKLSNQLMPRLSLRPQSHGHSYWG